MKKKSKMSRKMEVILWFHEMDEANTLSEFISEEGLSEKYRLWSKPIFKKLDRSLLTRVNKFLTS